MLGLLLSLVVRVIYIVYQFATLPALFTVIAATVLLQETDFLTALYAHLPGAKETEESHYDGKVCLITGASSGIGRELALSLSSRGAFVIVVGRNEKALDEVVSQCRRNFLIYRVKTERHDFDALDNDDKTICRCGRRKREATEEETAIAMTLDLTKLDSIDTFADKAAAWKGRIDILFNNAGITQRSVGSDWHNVVEPIFLVNVRSQIRLTQRLLPYLQSVPSKDDVASSEPCPLQRRDSSPLQRALSVCLGCSSAETPAFSQIVNTLSVAARLPSPGRVAYCASKSSMLTYMTGLGYELQAVEEERAAAAPKAEGGEVVPPTRRRVFISNVLPGLVKSPIVRNAILGDGRRGADVGMHEDKEGGKMAASRCAELMLGGVARCLPEIWVSTRFEMAMTYLSYYAPWSFDVLMRVYGARHMLKKMRQMIDTTERKKTV